MQFISQSQWLFYGGIAVMTVTVVVAVVSLAVFFSTGRKIKRKLEEEYGKPMQ